MPIVSKLPEIGASIFAEMTALADACGAINLSQGFPDFDTHPELKALVSDCIQRGLNQYAPMPGVPALRERIAEKTAALYGARYDPDREITVTAGATEALYAAITAVVHPGDEVLLVEPAYDSYEPIVRLSGGSVTYYTLPHPAYRIDWDAFKRRIGSRTRLAVLNFPHNPTGAVLTAEDLEALAAIVQESGIVLVSDEVYEHVVFDGREHQSLCRHPVLRSRSFVVSSFAKTYHTTGWKVGYCLAPAALTAELRKIHQFLTFAVNTPVQHAYALFLQEAERYRTLPAFYQRKRDTFLAMLAGSRFRPLPCAGTYYLLLDYGGISEEPEREFARRLATQHGVAAIPPAALYHRGGERRVLRFCFAKRDETLAAAAERLRRV